MIAMPVRQMDRYLAASVLKCVGVVLLCLLTLVTLFTAIDELADPTPGYGKANALRYVLWSTPQRIVELTPYAVFMGALIGLGTLSGSEEITVLRAAGVSIARLFASVAATALVVLGLNAALGEFLAPAAETAAGTLKLRSGEARGIRSAQWQREGNLYTNIDGYAANGDLLGVRQYAVADGRMRFSRRAERGSRSIDSSGREHWLLHDVVETHFDENSTRVLRHASLPWHSTTDPALFSAKALFEPGKLSLRDLIAQIRHRQREGLDPSRYQMVLWGKALQPLAVLGLVLLALGFVIGPLRETGMGARLTVGIAVGLAFKYLLDAFAPIGIVFAMPPWLAMSLPVALCWLAAAATLRRI